MYLNIKAELKKYKEDLRMMTNLKGKMHIDEKYHLKGSFEIVGKSGGQ